MSSYTRTVKEVIEFDGDQLTVEFNRLKREQFMELQPYFKTGDSGEVVMELDDQKQYFKVVEQILPDVIVSINGFVVDGELCSCAPGDDFFQEVITKIFFLHFTQEVLSKIVKASILDKTLEKKSKPMGKDSSVE